MPQVSVPVEQVAEAGRDFAAASAETVAMRERLEKRMQALAQEWDQASRQAFYSYYTGLGDQLAACTEMLAVIGREMQAMADRYRAIDR